MILYVFHTGYILRGDDKRLALTFVGDCAPKLYDTIANDYIEESTNSCD